MIARYHHSLKCTSKQSIGMSLQNETSVSQSSQIKFQLGNSQKVESLHKITTHRQSVKSPAPITTSDVYIPSVWRCSDLVVSEYDEIDPLPESGIYHDNPCSSTKH